MSKLRFTTAGESHGQALVAILEGLPAGLRIDAGGIDRELARRQWGYGRGGRMKIERDQAEILSGVRHGLTLGSPIALMIQNKDWANWTDVMSAEPRDLPEEKSRRVKRPRPSHADLAAGQKYDARDLRNVLERASARETAAQVACGALAKQLLAAFDVEVRSHVIQLGGVPETPLTVDWDAISGIADDAPLRCAHVEAQQRMVEKPISTLRRALRSVDIDTKEEEAAAFERSDVTAVPAAGVIGEAMIALVLAGAMIEKFGGDSMGEMRRNFDGYSRQLHEY